ncbi:MAG: hypothetical protein ACE5EQ_10640, partial [Phycisphaerae bacterium]
VAFSGLFRHLHPMVYGAAVNGRIVYDKAAESLFADIRPRTPTTQPAKFKFWPRPFKRPSVSSQNTDTP